MEDSESREKNPSKKKNWIVPTITTLIGVAVSLLVAWYQITLSEEQTLQAEIERSKSVKNELIQIVEEHIINNKGLDIPRLSRLSEFKARQEKLLIVPSVSEIIEGAEFNILKSQYLEFSKKEKFKSIFNEIYLEISPQSKISYTGFFENPVNELHSAINSNNTNEANAKLNKLMDDVNKKIDEINLEKSIRESKSFEDILKVVLEKPMILIMVMSAYIVLLFSFLHIIRGKRRRQQLEEEMLDEYRRERSELFMKRFEKDYSN